MSVAAPNDVAVAEVLRDETVRRGWQLVAQLERLEAEEGDVVVADELRLHARRAASTLAPLRPWSGLTERQRQVYSRPANQVRLRRILDFVLPGDRVVDVGAGRGYLTGVCLRDSELSAYHGIDISEHVNTAPAEMMRENGLTGRSATFEVKDLHTITPEWMGEHRPDLVIVLEVLEHVPDPERALATLAAALPQDAAILFSVPILGRLEACWGHVSLFDVPRLQQMCRRAGLTVQLVEPLHNVWTLVLASRDPRVPARATAAIGSLPVSEPARESVSQLFRAIPVKKGTPRPSRRWTARADVDVAVTEQGLRCAVVGHPRGDTEKGRYGGVELTANGLDVLRLELSFDAVTDLLRVFVDGHGSGRKPVVRWVWDVAEGTALPTAPKTYVLRPGQRSGPFRPSGRPGDTGGVRTVHVFVEVAPRGRATFVVHRAAYVR